MQETCPGVPSPWLAGLAGPSPVRRRGVRLPRLGVQWQPYDESRSAVPRELCSQFAAVQLHDLTADVQPEPDAAVAAVGMRAVEPFEDSLALLGRDADAVVADGDLDGIGW